MGRLAEERELFAEMCIPKDAHEVQRTETIRAFMGGAATMLRLLFEAGGENESEAIALLEECRIEVEDFTQKLLRGER